MRVHPVTGVYKLHNGVDLRGAKGTPIYAVDKGIVTKEYFNSAGGNQVIIEHKDFSSGYAHLDSVYVTENQEVNKGDLIGTVGDSGAVTGSHLHFVIKQSGEYQEPISFIQSKINRSIVIFVVLTIAVVLLSWYVFKKYRK